MKKTMNESTLAIIPCYNEEATIGSIVIRTKRHVDRVLVVDDGSTDDTVRIAKEAGATVISHKTNKGKSAGIKTGFKYALIKGFNYVVTIDGDGQHNPDEIPVVLGNLQNNGHDIILGVRYGDSTEMPLWRKFGKRVLDYSTSFGNGGHVTDSQCGFRAFNKKAIQGITPRLNGGEFSTESEQLIKEILPEQYQQQVKLFDNVPDQWRFGNLFTSSISNYNISAPFHRDAGNIVGAVNVIICKKLNSRGGDLHIPDYNATIGQQDNSILVYPAWKNMHGVTPIIPTHEGGYRNSLIFYPLKAFLVGKE